MITLEQKKKLQFDAGIPHLPTDLTYECRMAISGEGERAFDWRDKPHRLVYDLSRQVEADADRIEELERENDRLRLTIDAAAKLGRIVGFLGDDEGRISAFIEACGPDLIERARTVLAEPDGEPLGAEFEAVWDANKDKLYEA